MTTSLSPATPVTGVLRTWTSVLFDLDGTITDSAPGIVKCLEATFRELDIPIPSPREMLAYVGPPILDSFRDLAHLTEEQSREALVVYRRHYLRDGVYDSAVIPGIAGLLKDLHDAGIPLAVATSKPEFAATDILEHFGLDGYFTVISGASADERTSAKADVVAAALRRLDAEGADLGHPVLVGDRDHDIVGAAANGLPAIMVEWGYGSPAEATGAVAVVHSTDQLRRLLLG